ncbi:MAG: nitroreductase family protein [Bacteroidota bacterium]|nr:nitroreductase family protein [Bacteroidota bacterium]
MIDKKLSFQIRKRRSVYPSEFTKKKLSDDIVKELLLNANHAPSHKLTQPWFFKVFSGKSKEKLATEVSKLNPLKSNTNILKKFELSSHIICICLRESKKVPYWEEIASTAMAVQNIWITLVDSKNIGGYWSTPKNISKLKYFLKLDKNEECLGLFHLGVYDKINNRNINRKNINDYITWHN